MTTGRWLSFNTACSNPAYELCTCLVEEVVARRDLQMLHELAAGLAVDFQESTSGMAAQAAA